MSVRSILADSRQHDGRLSPVTVDMKMKLLNLNSITRSLFSKRFYDYGDEGDSFAHDRQEAVEFKELTDDMFRLVAVPILGDYVPYLSFLDRLRNYKQQMQQTQKRVDTFLSRVLENHRDRLRSAAGAVLQERDLLDVLLSLAGHALGDFQLDDDRIKGAITSFTLAGTSSAASVVEWALAELLRAPQLLHKAQQELDSVVGRERLVAEADIPPLPFLQAVIKETFRLHPPLTLLLPHESIEDCQVRGYRVPAKTTLFVNVWEIGRNPEVWENPLEFRPERFEASEIEPEGKHFELLPFGTGRRGCPAINLGLLSAQHALARLLQAFDWSLPDGQTAENLDMAEGSGLSTPRAQPLWALPHPRLPANMY